MIKSQKWNSWRPEDSSMPERVSHWGPALARRMLSAPPRHQWDTNMDSMPSSLEEVVQQAVAREAAALGGLSPALFLLGELSREDPGDPLGLLFRELSRGPGPLGPSVGDTLQQGCALRGQGTGVRSPCPWDTHSGSCSKGYPGQSPREGVPAAQLFSLRGFLLFLTLKSKGLDKRTFVPGVWVKTLLCSRCLERLIFTMVKYSPA